MTVPVSSRLNCSARNMSYLRDCVVFASICLLAGYFYFTPDVRSIVKVFFQCFAILAIGLFIFNILEYATRPLRCRVRSFINTQKQAEVDSVEVHRRLLEARERSQHSFQTQATEYIENVVNPRIMARRKKQELKWKRLFGDSVFMSDGHKLEDGSNVTMETSGSNMLQSQPPDSGSDNTLPPDSDIQDTSVTSRSTSTQPPGHHVTSRKPQSKRIQQLPEEPPLGEPGVVTLALRTPDSDIHKRRFRVTNTVQNVLDYMESLGYSSMVYSLMMSYPRKSMSDQSDSTLEEIGLKTDTALLVDEK